MPEIRLFSAHCWMLEVQNSNTLSADQKILPFWLMWRIWKSLNDLIFKKLLPRPEKDVVVSIAEVNEWLIVTNHGSNPVNAFLKPPRANNHHEQWVRPPFGFVKCNFDVAFNSSSRQVKRGWIVRDHLGIYS